MAEEKQPIVIEMTTSLRTGVTALVGVSAVPCPSCKGQDTVYADGHIECRKEGCKAKTPVG
jgi:hypothetical protein